MDFNYLAQKLLACSFVIRGLHPEPELKLYNSFIKIVPEMIKSPFFIVN